MPTSKMASASEESLKAKKLKGLDAYAKNGFGIRGKLKSEKAEKLKGLKA